MRKLVILALIFAISAISFGQDACPAGEVKGDTACVKCNDAAIGGFANCGACTFTAAAAADKKITCTKCSANFYFSTSAKTACVKCADNCNGGDCADETAAEAPVTKTKCTSCVSGFVLASDACSACTTGCGTCSAVADGEADGKCTTCNGNFFKNAKNFCEACGEGCKSCKTSGDCDACANAEQFVNRVDNGKCIATCPEGRGQGVLPNGQKVCSDFAAPVPMAVAAEYQIAANASNALSISALCAPVSTEADKKKMEQVGAIAAASLDVIADIDINVIRGVIKTGSKASDADFAAKNTVLNAGRANWINIIGTDAGAAALDKFVVPRGASTLYYVCINGHGVKSALKSSKILNNATLNPSVRFSLTLSQALNDTALNNLTCSVAAAIFPGDATNQATVKNQKGLACSSKRVLQAAAASYSDLWFEVPANQNNDAFADSVKAKAADVKTALAAFAKSYNVTVVADAAAESAPSGQTFVAPVIGVSQLGSSSSNVTVNFNSTAASANLFWAVVASGAAADDAVVRGSGAAIKKDKLSLEVGANSSVVIALNASTSYDLYYYAANKFDSTKNTGIKKLTVSTAALSSGLLSVASFVLLVLALFI